MLQFYRAPLKMFSASQSVGSESVTKQMTGKQIKMESDGSSLKGKLISRENICSQWRVQGYSWGCYSFSRWNWCGLEIHRMLETQVCHLARLLPG